MIGLLQKIEELQVEAEPKLTGLSLNGRTESIKFQIWDGILEFKLPKSNLSLPSEQAAEFYIDKQPFINTRRYKGFSPWAENSLCLDAYRTGWYIKGSFLPKLKKGEVTFRLEVFSRLSQNGENEIILNNCDSETFIDEIYQKLRTRFGGISFVPTNNEFYEIVQGSAQELTDLEVRKIGFLRDDNKDGQTFYMCQPASNVMDFFLPVGAADLVRFSFEVLEAETLCNEKLKATLISQIYSVMAGVSYLSNQVEMRETYL